MRTRIFRTDKGRGDLDGRDESMNRLPFRRTGRLIGFLAIFLLALPGTGCDDLLEVEDPVNLTPDDLTGGAPVDLTVNGIRGAFQEMMDNYVMHTGMMTDEFILAGTFPYRAEIDERATLTNNSGLLNELYNPISVTRFMADTGVVILEEAEGRPGLDEAEVRQGLALAKYYGAYSRMLLAESFCESPIASGPPLSSDERMQDALQAFQEAEAAAQTAGDSNLAGAARLGQARAQLWLGDYGAAASLAGQVPSDLAFYAHYSGNSVAQYNRVADVTHALDDTYRWTVGDGSLEFTAFERWPYFDEWVQLGLLVPRPDLESFNPSVPVVLQMKYASADDPIPVATASEARLIQAEVLLRNGDPDAASAIVNDLRETNWGLDPILFSGNLSEDLPILVRERARELYLTGERIGTFRRLIASDGIDMFPTGKLGNQTCFPIPERETDTNPNF